MYHNMKTLSTEEIIEIADQIDMGFRCFFHKDKSKLLFIPDLKNEIYIEEGFYQEELEELENNFADYIEIERPQSKDSFEIMVDFAEQLNDKSLLKVKLINALNNKKPFREFKQLIDNSGDYREEWFEFKTARLRAWVNEKFNDAIQKNE